MEEQKDLTYLMYESSLARMERLLKRLIIALIVAIVIIFASNIAWLHAWSMYDYESSETTTITQDGEGINVMGDGNEVSNGAESSMGTE